MPGGGQATESLQLRVKQVEMTIRTTSQVILIHLLLRRKIFRFLLFQKIFTKITDLNRNSFPNLRTYCRFLTISLKFSILSVAQMFFSDSFQPKTNTDGKYLRHSIACVEEASSSKFELILYQSLMNNNFLNTYFIVHYSHSLYNTFMHLQGSVNE